MAIYLDNAATSNPKPQQVIDAVIMAMSELNANPGRSGHSRAIQAGRLVLEARETLAKFLGADDAFSVVFQFNATDALNQAIKGVLRPGDHVISTMLEHNSVLRPLSCLSAAGIIDLTLVNPRADGMVDPDDIRIALQNNTQLIAVTQASNVTGAVQPVAAIGALAEEAGIPYLIDGSQALGGMPVDVKALRCDMYAFPGHKGLLGPQGTGGLYVKPGLKLIPLREGGTGTDSANMLQPEDMPECLESGTLNLPGIAGLKAGVEYVSDRLSSIMAHERELTSALREALDKIDGITIYSPSEEAGRSGIISFNVGDYTSAQVAEYLDGEDIQVRGGLHCAPGAHRFLGTLERGCVRASVGYDTEFSDVDSLVQSIYRLMRDGM